MPTTLEDPISAEYERAVDAALLAGASGEEIEILTRGRTKFTPGPEGGEDSFIPSAPQPPAISQSFIPTATKPDNHYSYDAVQRLSHLAAISDGSSPALSYQQIFAEKQRNIEQGLEDLNRQKAYSQRVQEQTTNLQSMVDAGETNQDVLSNSAALLRQTISEDDQFALEKQAVERIEKFADENPAWADLRLHNRDALSEIASQARKDAIIQTILQRRKALSDARGGFTEFVDDAGEILGDVLSAGATSLLSALRSQDWELSAQILREEGNRIRQLPEEQIPDAMEDLYDKMEVASGFLLTDEEDSLNRLQLAFGTDRDVRQATSDNLLEAIMFGAGLGFTKTAAGMFKKLGGASRVADDNIAAMRGELGDANLYETVEGAVEDSLYLRVADNAELDQVPTHVQRNLELNEAALQDITNLPNYDRLAPEELQQAAARQLAKLERVYNRAPIQQGAARFDESRGVYEMDVLVGRSNGEAFATQASATNYITRNNLDAVPVQQNGGWYAQQTQTITEQFADNGLSNVRPINLAQRVLQSPRSFIDEVMGRQGNASAFNEARITGVVKDIYNRNIRKLSSSQFSEMREIWNQGLKDERWYNPTELSAQFRNRFGKSISDEQVQAYYASRQIEDFSHFIQNRALYQEKNAKGLQTINLRFTNVGDFNGNVYTNADDYVNLARNARIYDAGSNTFVRGTPETLDRLQRQGYIMVRPEDASWTVEQFGEGASFIATKASRQVEVRDLDFNQLNYLPGGRRKYTDNFFVGQTRSGTFSDGTRYQLAPYTFRSARTRIEAEEWAAKYNAANEALRQSRAGRISDDEADRVIQSLVGRTRQEYDDMVEAEGWDINQAFKVKGDREDFPVDFEAREAVRLYDHEAIESGFGTTRNSRLSARGDQRLKNVNEEDAETLDFISAMNVSADQAIKMGSYNDFKISAINRFNTEFRKYIDDAEQLSPYEVATKGTVSEELRRQNPGLYNAVKAHQFYINSVLRNRGEWDERVQEALDQLAFKIEKAGEPGRRIAATIHERGQDPIGRLRGLNFDLNLGMFNPAQLLMQANSALTALAFDPRNGIKAFSDVPVMRYMLIANDEKFTRDLAKRTRGIYGAANEDEMIKAVDQFRRLGLNDFGANLAMIDNQNTLGATSNQLTSRVNRIRESGRFFFQEGERYGRLTAYAIARRRYQQQFPGRNAFDRDADNWIRNETDRLLLSPNSDNNQLFTKGITALPTQFWSYMGKMSDAILTGSNGRYSAAERVQLIGSQALFYGAAGIPLLDYFSNQYQTVTGNTLDANTQKFISNGLIDGVIFAATKGEVNTDFSGTSGVGGFWEQMYRNLWESPFSTLAFGATGSNLSGGFRAMSETARMYSLWHNPSPEAVTATALAGVGSVIKSLSRTTQAYMAYNTGIWYDRYGRALAGVSKGEAVASVFGLNPAAVSDTYSILSNNKDARNKYVNEAATTLQALHEKWERAETREEQREIEDLINTFSVISQQTGYFPEVAGRVQALKRDRTFQDSQERLLFHRYIKDQEDVNTNYLTLDQRRQILEDIE